MPSGARRSSSTASAIILSEMSTPVIRAPARARCHCALESSVEERDLPVTGAALRRRRSPPMPPPDTRAWNFVLGDDTGRQIDFHVIVLDEHGRGLYGPPENGKYYPAEALTGKGTVKGRAVDCIAPEWLVRFHTGYQLGETDWADVSALC